MLTSIILQLTAQENGRIRGSTGRAVHGFWFQQLQHLTPHLADQLHSSQPKPFTLTPLMGLPRPRRGTTHVQQHDQAWLRITTLDPALSRTVLTQWLPQLPATITLARIPWRVRNLALMPSEHPWAGQTSYTALRELPLADRWTLTFTTPTTFRVGADAHMPFPLPAALVGSWYRRWTTFSPVSLPIPRLETHLLQQQLYVSQYRLNTVPVRHGKRLTVGCVGQVTLTAGALPAAVRQTISILAAYAGYCGSGAKTTQGMGLTQFTPSSAHPQRPRTQPAHDRTPVPT